MQAKDKETGELVWSAPVLDPDESAPNGAKTVVIKISAPVQHVPPEAVAGLPFRPAEFDGLTVAPYVDDKRNRVAYSLRARAMHAPATGTKATPGNPSARTARSRPDAHGQRGQGEAAEDVDGGP